MRGSGAGYFPYLCLYFSIRGVYRPYEQCLFDIFVRLQLCLALRNMHPLGVADAQNGVSHLGVYFLVPECYEVFELFSDGDCSFVSGEVGDSTIVVDVTFGSGVTPMIVI